MSRVRTMSLGQRSRSQLALKAFGFLKSCSTHNFIMHGRVCKLFGTNDHHDKTVCRI